MVEFITQQFGSGYYYSNISNLEVTQINKNHQ